MVSSNTAVRSIVAHTQRMTGRSFPIIRTFSLRKKMNDRETLDGFLNASRYITRQAYCKYGFDIETYDYPPSRTNMHALRERYRELISTNKFVQATTKDELWSMLGPEYSWVCSSLPKRIFKSHG